MSRDMKMTSWNLSENMTALTAADPIGRSQGRHILAQIPACHFHVPAHLLGEKYRLSFRFAFGRNSWPPEQELTGGRRFVVRRSFPGQRVIDGIRKCLALRQQDPPEAFFQRSPIAPFLDRHLARAHCLQDFSDLAGRVRWRLEEKQRLGS